MSQVGAGRNKPHGNSYWTDTNGSLFGVDNGYTNCVRTCATWCDVQVTQTTYAARGSNGAQRDNGIALYT
jgi:hypothetical protein